VLSSTLQPGAIQISLSSTGAITAGATTVNAIYVSPSSKTYMNSIVHYVSGAGSEVGTAETFLGVSGSKAPTLFLSVGSSAGFNSGVAINNGFASGLSANAFLVSALATTMAIGLLKCTMGSKVYYIPMLTDTMVA